jgi:hypothetical protein
MDTQDFHNERENRENSLPDPDLNNSRDDIKDEIDTFTADETHRNAFGERIMPHLADQDGAPNLTDLAETDEIRERQIAEYEASKDNDDRP